MTSDIALAYRRAGNQPRFEDAMARLHAANQATLAQGFTSPYVLTDAAVYHALAGEREKALERLAQAVDGGLITGTRISEDFPSFKNFEGDPEYEAIQARMLEHLNRERALLGLEPASS